MAKVSVIIPTHNRPERLGNALRSVLEQTVTDFEVFVVDDGSVDDAAADVVRAYGDPRVSYIRMPHSRGPAAARNVGIARATAPYVAFIDDDDEWLPEKLRKQIEALDTAEDCVGGSYTARITVDRVAGREVETRFLTPFDRRSGLNVITLSSVVIRRSCFEAIGCFDEQLFGNEDFDLWIRLAERFSLRYVNEPLVRYFIYPDGISQHDQSPSSSNVVARGVKSIECLLAKHRRVFEADQRGHCLSYLMLAERYRHVRDLRNERRAVWQALRLWPFEPRAYLALVRWAGRNLRAPRVYALFGKPR